jgi:hypothetical protein
MFVSTQTSIIIPLFRTKVPVVLRVQLLRCLWFRYLKYASSSTNQYIQLVVEILLYHWFEGKATSLTPL